MTALRYPIYIPSKGRAAVCSTPGLLDDGGCCYRLVVEPQDRDAYAERFGAENILVLPIDDPGHVAFARNWIAQHARDAGCTRHWQIDDDLKSFSRWNRGKQTKIDAGEALSIMEQFTDRYSNIAISGPSQTVWGFTKTTPFNLNALCAGVLLIAATDQFSFRYVNEDIDYCIQVLAAGYCTVQFNAVTIDLVETNSNSIQYSTIKRRLELIAKTRALWPSLDIRIQAHGGRINTTRVWKNFRTRLQPIEHA